MGNGRSHGSRKQRWAAPNQGCRFGCGHRFPRPWGRSVFSPWAWTTSSEPLIRRSALPRISRLVETEADKKTEVTASGGRVAADQRLSCFGGRYFRFPAADARRGRAVLGLRRLIASPASR